MCAGWSFLSPLPRAGLLNPNTVGILGLIVLRYGDCPGHCRICNSSVGLYLLDASRTPRDDSQKCHLTLSTEGAWGPGQNASAVEKPYSRV